MLRQQIRAYMDNGPVFDAFLNEAGQVQFLTNGVVVFGNDRGLDPADFPLAADVINNNNPPAGVRARFETTIRNEPINMMKYIVKNDRPWTDIVAGQIHRCERRDCTAARRNGARHVHEPGGRQ